MDSLIGNQAYVFIIYILSGILIGIFFDVFRILRKSFKTPDIVTYLEDILFWIITGIFLLYVIFKFNNGEIRSYIFLGLAFGVLSYILIFSKHFVNINVKLIKFLKTIVNKLILIILYPLKLILKFVRKILLKPIVFLSINVKKTCRILSKPVVLLEKYKKILKKPKQKKDFE